MENGLVFSGEFVHRIKEILPVKTIFQNLLRDIAAFSGAK